MPTVLKIDFFEACSSSWFLGRSLWC